MWPSILEIRNHNWYLPSNTCSKIITFHAQQLCLQEAPSSPYVAVGVRQNVNNQLKVNKQLTWSKFRIFHSQHLCSVSVSPYLIVWQKVNNQLKVNKQLTCSKILTFHTQQLCIASMRPYLPLHCSIWQILPEERSQIWSIDSLRAMALARKKQSWHGWTCPSFGRRFVQAFFVKHSIAAAGSRRTFPPSLSNRLYKII